MKIKYLSTLVAASIVSFTTVVAPTQFATAQANPCAADVVNPCAANPCAANPCAANPCAANPCAANPCAANPCAADPCAANPCAANPCAADPCAANPCAADPCAANPCAANPCAADPCAANPCAANPCAANPCAANPCAANPCAAAVVSDIPTVFSDPQVDNNVAIRGYDPVAYFTVGAPVEGSGDYEYEWNGVTWRFSSAANKELFASNPETYAPQYGGYCAKALSEGNLASTVPEAWDIVDGKLYLNYSLDVQKQWKGDVPGNVAKADSKWPTILGTSGVVYYDTVGAVYF